MSLLYCQYILACEILHEVNILVHKDMSHLLYIVSFNPISFPLVYNVVYVVRYL